MSSNIDAVLKQLSGTLERQIPFAVSKALNDTGFDIRRDLADDLDKKLDRPTPFTKRAFGLKKSSKTNPKITIYVRETQAQYLKYAIFGGKRRDNVQPVAARLNRYGNIAGLKGGRKIKTLLAKPNTYQATINGTRGIWQRTKAGTKLLMVLGQDATYKRRFPFRALAFRSFKRNIYRNTRKAVLFAIRTAR